MPLWGNIDQANSAPKDIAEILNVGSGNAGKLANNLSLWDNTTANTVFGGVTVAVVLITATEIETGSYPGAVAGWNIQRTGSGGRSGRVFYEPIVAMGSGYEPVVVTQNQSIKLQQYVPVLGL